MWQCMHACTLPAPINSVPPQVSEATRAALTMVEETQSAMTHVKVGHPSTTSSLHKACPMHTGSSQRATIRIRLSVLVVLSRQVIHAARLTMWARTHNRSVAKALYIPPTNTHNTRNMKSILSPLDIHNPAGC